MKNMADTFETQAAVRNISLPSRMREYDVSGGAERLHKMRPDESVSPCHENAFALKIHLAHFLQ
jgi:hypothetical protein